MMLMVEQSTLLAGNARSECHQDGLASDAEPVDPSAGFVRLTAPKSHG